MPELPDVERFGRLLALHAFDQAIVSVKVQDSKVVRGVSRGEFARRLKGRTFARPERHGKWLLAPTDGPILLLHFGMTGSLVWDDVGAESDRFNRVQIILDQGSLLFRDQRNLGSLWLASDEGSIHTIIGPQGPDALNLTGRRLEERLARRRGAVKSALMDQKVLGGIGNMLSDEVLWRAGIHPERHYGDLDDAERHHLDLSLQRVLRASVKKGAIPRLNSWLSSQRSKLDPRCPLGHGPLSTSRIGGRTSYWCPVCQPRSGT